MATLTGQQIDASYQGILKTLDNAGLDGTNRVISDGVGTALPLEASTTTIKFTGNADFTSATVTGDNNTTYVINSVQDGANADIKLTDALGNDSKVTLVSGTNVTLTNLGNDLTIDAADTNTTYSLGSVQDGSNADIVLTDQLGNTSKATLVAGTNITLTNSGNDLTIAAAGGSAGLVAGTGSNSVQSAVTGATGSASVSNSIAIGNGASALGGTGAMAYGNDAVANGTHSASFGQYAEATNSYAIAFGRTSVASGDGSVAFGQQTSAGQQGAVAMGRQVTSINADTTHVRALYVVAPDGGTGGNGITMLSPNGTAYTLTVSNAGALVIS
jgi:trimeric autotransporter adhesin